MRLRCKKTLVVFTSRRTSDKYLIQSVKKGLIEIPKNKVLVKDGTLFLFDDISSLGMTYPRDLIGLLEENNQPCVVYDAKELASSIIDILPERKNISILSGGGVLSYLYLKKCGYKGNLGNIIEVKRKYVNGKPVCELIDNNYIQPDLIMDDILASGQTLATVLDTSQSKDTEFACLLSSSNVSKGDKGYRTRQGSTIPKVKKLYCSQFVNGIQENGSNKKPAILSLRYLLTKAVDNDDYSKGYLEKKFGGKENTQRILELIRKIDREPIDYLRKDPINFLKKYGGI